MSEHEQYMQDFMTVFEPLESWGPNSVDDTSKAFTLLNRQPNNILEIGCGKGNSTIAIAKLCSANIIATDNASMALSKLEEKLARNSLTGRVKTQCVSMTELNFGEEQFDVIWAEASAYIMGVESALEKWKPLLKDNGALVFSDLVWLTDKPSQASVNHWKKDYPDIQSVDTRKAQIEKAGYQLAQTFTLSERAWQDYYEPLQQRLNHVASGLHNSQALRDIQNEINLYKRHLGEFGYQFFIATKR